MLQVSTCYTPATQLASLDAGQPEDGTGGVGIVPLTYAGQGNTARWIQRMSSWPKPPIMFVAGSGCHRTVARQRSPVRTQLSGSGTRGTTTVHRDLDVVQPVRARGWTVEAPPTAATATPTVVSLSNWRPYLAFHGTRPGLCALGAPRNEAATHWVRPSGGTELEQVSQAGSRC
jgi:hypothetical protein